jgi:hypothetical protein
MNPKYKNIKMHLVYCLMQLLLECLDELKVTNPRMIELKNNMIEFCELLNEETKDTYTVQKTTYFQQITHKINTILRKEFDDKM